MEMIFLHQLVFVLKGYSLISGDVSNIHQFMFSDITKSYNGGYRINVLMS